MSGASSAVDADASHGSFGIIMGPPQGLGPDPTRKRKIGGGGVEGSGAEHGLPRHPSTCTSRQVCIQLIEVTCTINFVIVYIVPSPYVYFAALGIV